MRIRKGTYFESKVRLERVAEDGAQAKLNELYVVDAVSFTECEQRVVEAITPYSQGEFEVLTEVKAPYGEIIFSDKSEECFYRVKVDFITTDERTGKQKHTKSLYLVQGESIETAKKNVDDALGDSMIDFKILSVSETAVVDIINA